MIVQPFGCKSSKCTSRLGNRIALEVDGRTIWRVEPMELFTVPRPHRARPVTHAKTDRENRKQDQDWHHSEIFPFAERFISPT